MAFFGSLDMSQNQIVNHLRAIESQPSRSDWAHFNFMSLYFAIMSVNLAKSRLSKENLTSDSMSHVDAWDQPTRQIVCGFYLELTRTHKAHRETQSGVVVWQLRNRYSVECADYLSGWLPGIKVVHNLRCDCAL